MKKKEELKEKCDLCTARLERAEKVDECGRALHTLGSLVDTVPAWDLRFESVQRHRSVFPWRLADCFECLPIPFALLFISHLFSADWRSCWWEGALGGVCKVCWQDAGQRDRGCDGGLWSCVIPRCLHCKNEDGFDFKELSLERSYMYIIMTPLSL